MSAYGPVDPAQPFAREEIDEVFQHHWRLGGAGERWAEFSDLYTVYDWHTVQGNCVSNGTINRFDNPQPGGPPLDFAGVTIQVYAGDGLWSHEEDYSSWEGMQLVRSEYEGLCAQFDPEHPLRRTRLEWPSSPEWAIGLAKHPNGL